MRCACIDIGSNTTRLLVADTAHGGLGAVLQQRAFTRIGRKLGADGGISAHCIADVAAVVAAQRAAAEQAGAQHVRVVATAAIRAAPNRAALVRALRERAGVEAVILSGQDEARLAFAGAVATLPVAPAGAVAVVDVGGGSTEVALGTAPGGVTWWASFPIGSSALAGRQPPDPLPAERLAAMRARAAAAFAALDAPAPDVALAVGGSAASLPRLAGRTLDAPALERALARLAAAPAQEIAAEHGIELERVLLLPAGLLVLGAVAERLGRPLSVAHGGLREGVVLELARS